MARTGLGQFVDLSSKSHKKDKDEDGRSKHAGLSWWGSLDKATWEQNGKKERNIPRDAYRRSRNLSYIRKIVAQKRNAGQTVDLPEKAIRRSHRK
jgi:hypothetical protein